MAFARDRRSSRSIINLVGKKGVHVVGHKLESDAKYTEVRVLPSVDANGCELPPFDPSIEDVQDLDNLITFAQRVTLVRDFGFPESYSFVEFCDHFANGTPFENESPLSRCIYAVRGKLYEHQFIHDEINALISTATAGDATQFFQSDCPHNWLQKWFRPGYEIDEVRKPMTAWAMRCLVMQENGSPILDNDGQQVYNAPALFLVTDTAFRTLLKPALSRLREDQPIGFNNSRMMDFVSSVNGVCLSYMRTTVNGKTGYSLQTGKDVTPVTPEELASYSMPWTDMINILSVEEQIALALKLMGPEAVDYGLRLDNRYADEALYALVPDNVKGMSANISAAMNRKDLLINCLQWDDAQATAYVESLKERKGKGKSGGQPSQAQQPAARTPAQAAPRRVSPAPAAQRPPVAQPVAAPRTPAQPVAAPGSAPTPTAQGGARRPMPPFPVPQARPAPAPLMQSPVQPVQDAQFAVPDDTEDAVPGLPPPTVMPTASRPVDPSAAGFGKGLQQHVSSMQQQLRNGEA